LAPAERADEDVVSPMFASWMQLDAWPRQIDGFRLVA
jgi:hypothetical protein